MGQRLLDRAIARCVIATDKAGLGRHDGSAEGLDFTPWRDDGYVYVPIGETDPQRPREMAEDARRQI